MKQLPLPMLLCLCATGLASSATPLDEASFRELHAQLAPPAEEAWRDLPWQDSLLTAQALAAREDKPVYMLVRSGHPLGCV